MRKQIMSIPRRAVAAGAVGERLNALETKILFRRKFSSYRCRNRHTLADYVI